MMNTKIKEQFEIERKNYHSLRDELVKQFSGKWVAISDGKVVASGSDPTQVGLEAYQKGYKTVYVNKVGEEDKLEARIRVRRKSWEYDTSYPLFAIPKISVTFYNIERNKNKFYTGAIVDSGSDVSVLPYRDCSELGICNFPLIEIPIRWTERAKVEQKSLYFAFVEINGFNARALVDADNNLTETILGRDVLNNFKITLDGKKQQVIVSD